MLETPSKRCVVQSWKRKENESWKRKQSAMLESSPPPTYHPPTTHLPPPPPPLKPPQRLPALQVAPWDGGLGHRPLQAPNVGHWPSVRSLAESPWDVGRATSVSPSGNGRYLALWSRCEVTSRGRQGGPASGRLHKEGPEAGLLCLAPSSALPCLLQGTNRNRAKASDSALQHRRGQGAGSGPSLNCFAIAGTS